MQYCYHCAKLIRRGNLSKHCNHTCGKETRALKVDETPPNPWCINWKEYIYAPFTTVPKMPIGVWAKPFDPKSNQVDEIRKGLQSSDQEDEEMPDPEPEPVKCNQPLEPIVDHKRAVKRFEEGRRKDKCGNPMIYPKGNKLTKSEFKQIKKYSFHCA